MREGLFRYSTTVPNSISILDRPELEDMAGGGGGPWKPRFHALFFLLFFFILQHTTNTHTHTSTRANNKYTHTRTQHTQTHTEKNVRACSMEEASEILDDVVVSFLADNPGKEAIQRSALANGFHSIVGMVDKDLFRDAVDQVPFFSFPPLSDPFGVCFFSSSSPFLCISSFLPCF